MSLDSPENVIRLLNRVSSYLETSNSPSRILVSSDLRAIISILESNTSNVEGEVLTASTRLASQLEEYINWYYTEISKYEEEVEDYKKLFDYIANLQFLKSRGPIKEELLQAFTQIFAKDDSIGFDDDNIDRYTTKLEGHLKDLAKAKTDNEFKEKWLDWYEPLKHKSAHLNYQVLRKQIDPVSDLIQGRYRASQRYLDKLRAELKVAEERLEAERAPADEPHEVPYDESPEQHPGMARFREDVPEDPDQGQDEFEPPESQDQDQGDYDVPEEAEGRFSRQKLDSILRDFADSYENPPDDEGFRVFYYKRNVTRDMLKALDQEGIPVKDEDDRISISLSDAKNLYVRRTTG